MTASYRFQGMVVLDPNVEEDRATLSQAKADFPVVAVNYGEEIASVRGLIQKFAWVGDAKLSNSVAAGAVPPYFIVTYPPSVSNVTQNVFARNIAPGTSAVTFVDPVTGVTGTPAPWTWSAHYLAMYNGYRGGFRVKVFANTDWLIPSAMLMATHISAVEALYITNYLSTGDLFKRFGGWLSATPTYVRLQYAIAAAEFSIPFYCPYKYTSTGQYNASFSGGLGTISQEKTTSAGALIMVDNLATGTPFAGTVKVLTAAGPDCSVSRFRRVPGLKLA